MGGAFRRGDPPVDRRDVRTPRAGARRRGRRTGGHHLPRAHGGAARQHRLHQREFRAAAARGPGDSAAGRLRRRRPPLGAGLGAHVRRGARRPGRGAAGRRAPADGRGARRDRAAAAGVHRAAVTGAAVRSGPATGLGG
ncbi:hypothetical protein SBRY_40890 [Actinacidiphila bryophytorum]|uniref:Uncharacterized protein n=1 Tax=Actinacidiphila bryophytorum TaxID=1436133 RepID=A0A9W4H3Y3_9ACTN|nr:hypothetical protein SBRY_40890 [Actinacidiphila bryophytorum]